MENYVANVIPHLQQWWPVIIRLAYLIGIVFAVVSLVQAVSRKQRFNRSTAIWSFICAVLLLNLPALMDSLSMTVFNQSSEQALSYSPPSSPVPSISSSPCTPLPPSASSALRGGLCLIRDTPNQSMNLSRGLVHLFGGILAVNLVTFLARPGGHGRR